MEKTNIEKLNIVVDEFLSKEENEKKKEQPKENECTTQECKMKNGEGLLERMEKKYITSDGRQLLNG